MSDTVSFGYQDVPREEKTARVGEVFASVAGRYDLMNDAMSGGMHRLWKDRFVRRVAPRPGEQILDMAGGTGDIAFRLAAKGAAVTVADINAAMLEVGMERARKRGIEGLVWSEQNAEELAFGDRAYDAYTIAFSGAAGASGAWSFRRRSGPASARPTTPIPTASCPGSASWWRATRTATATSSNRSADFRTWNGSAR